MDKYEFISKIGDGSFGSVYLCRIRNISSGSSKTTTSVTNSSDSEPSSLGELVAVKKMKKSYNNWDECMKLREIRALKKLNHRNVILLKEVIREKDHLYLIFEHMQENLYQVIRSQVLPFTECKIRRMTIQIVDGLAFIHKNGFFHRDIKPENLLCKNNGETIKIADFGLSREIDSEPPYTDYVSTRWYRAPELLLHSTKYNWAVDIWALGCIMGELYTLKPLFPGRGEIDQIFKICQLIGPPNPETWSEGFRLASSIQFKFPSMIPLNFKSVLSECSDEGLDLLKVMLNWVSEDRPSANQLSSHVYFL